jgi:hypothetical protein
METPAHDDIPIAVDLAGARAGIPPRTLRDWISKGKLPAVAGPRGKLVRMGDVRRIAVLTGRSVGNAGGNVRARGNVATGTPGNVAEPDTLDDWIDVGDGLPSLPAIDGMSARLAAFVGQAMAPVIAQLTEQAALREAEQAEMIGRLREREENARDARDAAERARRDEASQADQLVNLLEERIRELERRLQGNDTSGG